MSTLTNSQTATLNKLIERLQNIKNSKTGEFEVKTEITQTGEMSYYLTMCQLMNVIRVCKGAMYYIAEQPTTKEVDCFDVINTLEIAEQLNDRVMCEIDILDKLTEFLK